MCFTRATAPELLLSVLMLMMPKKPLSNAFIFDTPQILVYLRVCVRIVSVSFLCHTHPFTPAIFLSYSNNLSFYIDSIWCRATVFRLTNLYTSLEFNHLHCYFCCFLLFLITISRSFARFINYTSI